ncbi:YkgJ family cysteine cluster protein [Carboxylicivirga caseinilyticus]|uniref:YkgJ family cysteine cluster protein n=1 Tax=Carboxylicivirga caseinilyticus TaxID=3417572 RepID=UPI003D3382DC|nr:YkgJ family cysteine cluster protein [Marinilabiliaceae bacterium A049]
MTIVHKVRAVERLFKTLEKDVQKLKEQTGISCANNCIKCCTTSNIEATPVEFYPLAYHLVKNDLSNDILSRIDQVNNSAICPLLDTFSINGSRIGCMFYEQRGLICRIFGYTYRVNKYDQRVLATCKTIQTEHQNGVVIANEILRLKPLGPKATDYYQRLQFVDYNKAQKMYPIGEAIKIAIETIATHFHYKKGKAM